MKKNRPVPPLYPILGILVALLVFASAGFSQGQYSDKVLSVTAKQGIEGQPLPITAEVIETPKVLEVLLAYRTQAASIYKQIEATLTGNLATASIPAADVSPSSIDYYFILRIQGKDSIETYTYPAQNPDVQPLRVDVMPASQKDNMIVFLSPEPSSSTSLEDLVISISLYKADTTIDKKGTKIYIDDRDVSSMAVLTGDLITLTPENISPPLAEGPHTVRVELISTDGKFLHKASIAFTQTSIAPGAESASKFQYTVNGQLEARNEDLDNSSTAYDRGSLNLNSQYDGLKVNGNLYLTNEDKPDVQPQDRYFIDGETSWLKVGLGDAFPTFPSLIMTGKRVRGVTADLDLGAFNVDYASGQIERKVEGDTIRTFPKDSLQSVQQSTGNGTGAVGPYNATDSIWALYRYGTYTRDITVVRPSFGSGNTFQWGFSYLHSKDDINSILYGIKPQENVAVGSDMFIGIDNKHIQLTGQYGASIVNTDISSGNISDTQIDSLFTGSDSTSQRNNFKKIKDLVSNFITVNQNIVPLGIDKISSIMAYEGALSLDYFSNYLKGTYIHHGSQYESFGQNYLRQDVQGPNVYDRIRLFQNQLFLSVGYERLQDNTDQSKLATTTFTTGNYTLSFFPRTSFPNFTIGLSTNQNSNGLVNSTDTTLARQAIEDKTNRFFVQSNYDFNAGSLRQSASIGFSTSSRTDQTLAHANTQTTIVSASNTTNWTDKFQTSLGVSLNINQLPQYTSDSTSSILYNFNYTAIVFGIHYAMVENKLHLSGIVGPTFGDISRMMFDVSADYLLTKNLTLVGDVNVLANGAYTSPIPTVTPVTSTASSTDLVSSFILRYNF
jgi:hypothetical protein